jgi:hypothetical protein
MIAISNRQSSVCRELRDLAALAWRTVQASTELWAGGARGAVLRAAAEDRARDTEGALHPEDASSSGRLHAVLELVLVKELVEDGDTRIVRTHRFRAVIAYKLSAGLLDGQSIRARSGRVRMDRSHLHFLRSRIPSHIRGRSGSKVSNTGYVTAAGCGKVLCVGEAPGVRDAVRIRRTPAETTVAGALAMAGVFW